MTVAQPFKPGDVIGGAIIAGELGRGGQAQVYRANYLHQTVAVKVILPGLLWPDDSGAIQRFEREQDLILSVRHPNIVAIHAAGIAKISRSDGIEKVPYLIMELMSTAAIPKRNQGLPWPQVVKIALDAARGLMAIHARGIVHRDIKPHNILIAEDGTAKVADFGLARVLDSKSLSVGYTPAYVSPEQFDQGLVASDDIPALGPDALSDIFSLGVTFYQLLAGHCPYEGSSEGLADYLRGHASAIPLRASAPEQLLDLVRMMMSLRRDGRPRTAAEVIATLEVIERGLPRAIAPVVIAKAEEDAVERYAQAYLRPALFERIRSLKGTRLGGWKVLSLYAIGGEGILARAEKDGGLGLLKMPHLPYDRPSEFGSAEIRHLRNELKFEAEMLNAFSNSLMPSPLELATGPNPLLSDRSPSLAAAEIYLVMEFVPGVAFDLDLRAKLRDEPSRVPTWLRRWLRRILAFLAHMRSTPPGYFYTDFKPSNLRVTPDGGIRMLDAGSITSAGSPRGCPHTPGYCPLDLLQSPTSVGINLELISLVSLARTLYASLMNKVIYEEVTVDFGELLPACGERLATWVTSLGTGKVRTIDEAARLLSADE